MEKLESDMVLKSSIKTQIYANHIVIIGVVLKYVFDN